MTYDKDIPLEEQFAADIKDLIDSGAGMPFVFNPGEAFMLLALLQLVLRHPQLPPSNAEFARGLAKNIEERLCVTPALKEVARQGWETEYDKRALWKVRAGNHSREGEG